jgi:hypothetical protein
LDNTDTVFGTQHQLATHMFTADGALDFDTVQTGTPLYSLTELYVITAPDGGVGQTDLSTQVINNVPEPSTWAMLGLGFAALGLVGMTKRRRKESRYAV